MDSGVGNRRMHVFFSGRVQGVGFRYTVCQMAKPFMVTGFVRNLMDGDVELVAEAEHQELMDFLNAIRGSMLSRYILEDRIGWEKATGEFDRFGISY